MCGIRRRARKSIERFFADAKEKHFMRYTHYRGLAKLRMQALLIFVAMNLKKLAKWKKKNGLLSDFCHLFSVFGDIISKSFVSHIVLNSMDAIFIPLDILES